MIKVARYLAYSKYGRYCMIHRGERTILRIQGTLHRIGDSVFLPDLNCNGTILRFLRTFVLIQPHDYGVSVRRLPRNLRIGSGINHCIRATLYSQGIYTRDNVNLSSGTFPVPSRILYVEPYFRTPL